MAEIRKQYHSLDLAKFISAVLIIVLHTGPLSSYSSVLHYGLRNIVTVVAVPFFLWQAASCCSSSSTGCLLRREARILSGTSAALC